MIGVDIDMGEYEQVINEINSKLTGDAQKRPKLFIRIN